jgi:hypothetical protein
MMTLKNDRRTLAAWIGGGTSLAAILAVGAIALWPASETDKARADGEAFGAAVYQLQTATSAEEVDEALVELGDAVAGTSEHVTDEVSEQIDDQADALSRAADGFVGERTADDAFEQDLYEYELDTAVDDLTNNAEDFRTQGPDVRSAFWEGYQDGVTAS